MKRGPGPKRTTELARVTPLVARTGLHRGGAELTRTPLSGRPTRTRSGPRTPQQARRVAQLANWVDLRLLVLDRDHGRCVRCGRDNVRLEVHHRRHKGQGGSRLLDHPANLATLCGWGNHARGDELCHGWSHARANTDAAAVGLTVVWGSDPLEVPVHAWDGVWLYDGDGGRRPHEAAS